MKNKNNDNLWVSILAILYKIIVFTIISYAVFILGYSGWWFCLLIITMVSTNTDEDDE